MYTIWYFWQWSSDMSLNNISSQHTHGQLAELKRVYIFFRSLWQQSFLLKWRQVLSRKKSHPEKYGGLYSNCPNGYEETKLCWLCLVGKKIYSAINNHLLISALLSDLIFSIWPSKVTQSPIHSKHLTEISSSSCLTDWRTFSECSS